MEQSLLKAGEWFDVEAQQVIALLNLGWEKPGRLWFYRVPTAEHHA